MALLKSRVDVTSLSDADLITRARDGHTDAFAELWRRHSRAGVTVARSYTSTFDPEDLVAEAYAKIFQIVRNGGGPQGAFRPYLFTTIRNTAASWGRSRNETAIDDADQIEDVNFSEENTLAALDRSLTAKAFRSLPTRWQEALWYSEVESMTPQEIAPLLGMKANAVAALTYRAREGLRQAWIQAHLLSVPEDSEHRWTIDHLGGYARRTLGKRDTTRIEEHLEECAKCSIVAAEAKDVGSRLALVLLPIAAGVAGATGYAAWMQTAAHGTAYAMGATGLAMPAAAIGAPLSSGTAGGAGGAGAGAASGGAAAGGASAAGVGGTVIGSVVTGALVVAGVTAAIALGPTLFAPPKSAQNPPAANGPSDGSGQSQLQAPSTPSPSPSPSSIPSPSPSQTTSPDAERPPVTSAPIRPPQNSPSPSPSESPSPSPMKTSKPPAKPQAPTTAPVIAAPAADTPTTTEDGSVPFSGTGAPGNTVTITASRAVQPTSFALTSFSRQDPKIQAPKADTANTQPQNGVVVATTTVGSDGHWHATVDLSKLGEGDYVLTVTQSNSAGVSPGTSRTVSFTKPITVPAAPVITGPTAGAVLPQSGAELTGTGEAGATITATVTQNGVTVRTFSTTVDGDGDWSSATDLSGLASGPATISVVQSNSAGTSTADTVAVSVALSAPVITSPANGATITASGAELAGTAEPGATIMATVTEGQHIVTTFHAVAGAGGGWLVTDDLSALDNGGYTVTVTQTNALGTTSPSTTITVTVAIPHAPAAPTLHPVSGTVDPAGQVAPDFEGTGVPGAEITLLDGGSAIAATTVAGAGTWSVSGIQGLGAGAHSVTVVQTAGGLTSSASPAYGFSLEAMGLQAAIDPATAPVGQVVKMSITGDAGSNFQLLIDGRLQHYGSATTIALSGSPMQLFSGTPDDPDFPLGLPVGQHTIQVRYVDATGSRFGALTAPITVTATAG